MLTKKKNCSKNFTILEITNRVKKLIYVHKIVGKYVEDSLINNHTN